MGEFRRFILSVVGGLEILFVVASTIVGGMFGAIVPALIGGGGAGFLGFVFGGLAGFCVSAILVNISMSLAEIAKNTQLTLQLLEGGGGTTAAGKKAEDAKSDLTEQETVSARTFLESRGVRPRSTDPG